MLLNLIKRSFIFALALCLTANIGFAQEKEAPADPYASWAGKAYPWPKSSLPAMQLHVGWEQIETQTLKRFIAEGNGLVINFSSLAPFRPIAPERMPEGMANTLVLEDSRYASGLLCITLFRTEDFMPQLDKDGLMGYAKALCLTNGKGGHNVEIVDAPGTLGNSTMMLMSMPPIGLTWKSYNAETEVWVLRTDYFFETEKGLLVVSIMGNENVQAYVRSAAHDVLRSAVVSTR